MVAVSVRFDEPAEAVLYLSILSYLSKTNVSPLFFPKASFSSFARRVSDSAGFGYGTRDVSSGSPGRLRPSRSETARTLSSRVRWFASERVWAVLSASRTESEELEPPDSTTYQRFEETVDRVTLGAGLRF